MAILQEGDFKKIIEAGRPQWILDAETEQVRLNVHINGKGTDRYLTQIDNIENAKQVNLRRKFLTTNQHVFANLSRPIDKVFSAKGGGKIYNLDSESQEEQLRSSLNSVRGGKSIRTWIQTIQANKYYTDPSGLVFFEVNDSYTYPTIKSIKSIFSYQTNGRELEWIVFKAEKRAEKRAETDAEYYRIVDDAYDYIIKKVGVNYRIVEEETFENPFNKVPAIINSDLINSDLTHAESPFEVVISLADHYLRTGTIKNLNEFLHGFPIFWRYLTKCKTCEGTGYVEGKKCSSCAGKGVNLQKDVTDIINLKVPESAEDIKLAPDLAGFVTPDVAGWQEMRIEQDWLIDLMELTMWGSKVAKNEKAETATAAFINVQPVNDRLNGFADSFEDMEKKMTDFIGIFLFGDYKGSSINYGRRFLVEPPDVIWKKYQEAKTAGAPKVTLDYLLMQFYQAEFANDLESLTIAQKGMKLETFIHSTDKEVKELGINSEDLKAKFYFSDWFKTVPQIDLLSKPVEILTKEYETYLKDKDYDSNLQGVESQI